MDVVYVVGPGDTNAELRHSLRSLTNLAHDTVWVAGHLPCWVAGVRHIPVDQPSTKYANSTANLRAACSHPDVSDRFVLMNDDFFIMRPVETVPVAHRGPVADVLAYYQRRFGPGRPYAQGMVATADLLAHLGIAEPLSYELHLPLVVDKAQMLEALTVGADIPVLHKRTLYGNLHRLGGELTVDVKIRGDHDQWSTLWPFLSTSPSAFRSGRVGRHIRSVFRRPGRYEKEELRCGTAIAGRTAS